MSVLAVFLCVTPVMPARLRQGLRLKMRSALFLSSLLAGLFRVRVALAESSKQRPTEGGPSGNAGPK